MHAQRSSALALLLALSVACNSPEPAPAKPSYTPPRPAPPVASTSDDGTPAAAEDPAPAGPDAEPEISWEPTRSRDAATPTDIVAGADGAEPVDPAVQAAVAGQPRDGQPGDGAGPGPSAGGAPSDADVGAGLSAVASPLGQLGNDLAIATVDGVPVLASELLALWHNQETRRVYEYVSTIVDAHIARADARRIGLTLDPALVEQRVTDIVMQIEEKLEEQAPGMTIREYASQRLGLDPDNYIAGLRASQSRALLVERVVRAWVLTQEHARIRVVIVTNEELAAEVTAALEAGRPFTEVASELSEDESASRGGLLPPVIRTEQLLLSRLAFATREGGVTGPVEDGGRILWVHVERFVPALEADWSQIRGTVEADLAARPLDEYEFLQWKSFVDTRHEVDMRPFLRLVGEIE